MTDTNDSNDRKAGGAGQGRTLTMRRPVEQSRVKQNFSHGRTKTVVVETRRKRPGGPGGKEDERPVVETKPQFQQQPRVATTPADRARVSEQQRSGVVLRTLTPEEKEAR